MSEIKFACPHCSQHIACDGDYAGTCIACPACGQPMVVPILNPTAPAHPDLCVVASTPAPRRKRPSLVPPLDPWTEKSWAEHSRATTGEPPDWTPLWLVSAIATIILAAVLKANGVGWTVITVSFVIGTILSGYFMAKGALAGAGDNSIARAAGTGLMTVFFLIVAMPVIAVGLLFIGCGFCG